LPDSIDWLEVRADIVGDLNSEWIRNHFRGKQLYSLRSRQQGGLFESSLEERFDRLSNAARSYDLVEIEERDLSCDRLLSAIPTHKRVIAWHGDAFLNLNTRFKQLAAVPALFYKLVGTAKTIKEEFAPLLLLKSLKRRDIIAYSDGPLGFWTRVLAAHLGAPVVFGDASSSSATTTQPLISKLIDDFGLPSLGSVTRIYGIVGDKAAQSLSPRLHNAAYRASDCAALFMPFQVDSFSEFWREAILTKLCDQLGFPIAGLTVTSPHKEAATLVAQTLTPIVRLSDGANVLLRANGYWKAETTDTEVVSLINVEPASEVRHRRAAVLGCGGAGRAVAAALLRSGVGVTLVNRTRERGQRASRLLDLPFVLLKDFDAKGYDLVVNATPVGRDDGDVPFDTERLNREATVVDLVYGTKPTLLVTNSIGRVRRVIDGREVLLTQVCRQFELMTGQKMSVDVAAESLGKREGSQTTLQRQRVAFHTS
jgi:3-dehydroquinate dehydratase/shikimate dehydrogenase